MVKQIMPCQEQFTCNPVTILVYTIHNNPFATSPSHVFPHSVHFNLNPFKAQGNSHNNEKAAKKFLEKQRAVNNALHAVISFNIISAHTLSSRSVRRGSEKYLRDYGIQIQCIT